MHVPSSVHLWICVKCHLHMSIMKATILYGREDVVSWCPFYDETDLVKQTCVKLSFCCFYSYDFFIELRCVYFNFNQGNMSLSTLQIITAGVLHKPNSNSTLSIYMGLPCWTPSTASSSNEIGHNISSIILYFYCFLFYFLIIFNICVSIISP